LIHGLQPRFLRYNSWCESDGFLPCTADWTIHAPSILPPPLHELANITVTKTIRENPQLIKSITPINVDQFEELLRTHPNRPFVDCDLLIYSNDFFEINCANDMSLDSPFNKLLPTNQFHLLFLWNKLGLSHKEWKQILGSTLSIIGIKVDPNCLTYTLSSAAQHDLIDEMTKFCRRRKTKARHQTGSSSYPLKQWQAGSIGASMSSPSCIQASVTCIRR
jgi:hypothetical protein